MDLGKIEVNPDDLMPVVYRTVAEGSEHIEKFISQPEYHWTWSQEKSRMRPVIEGPLLQYWNSISMADQARVKRALQYLLNVDKSTPYQLSKNGLDLKSKEAGIGAKYFNSYQDTLLPHDWYEYCLWIWEILFGAESWLEDVSQWRGPTLPVPRSGHQ